MTRFRAMFAVLLLGACGTSVTSDGGGIDAANEPDSGPVPGPASVTVFIKNAATAGVQVVFGDATGAFVAVASTDAAGRVTRVVNPGDTITVVHAEVSGPNTTYYIHSYHGVAGGDDLKAYLVPTATLAPGPTYATLSPTVYNGPGGTPSTYQASPCTSMANVNAPPTATSVAIVESCLAPGRLAHVLMSALDGAGTVLGYNTQKNVPTSGMDGTLTANFSVGNWSGWAGPAQVDVEMNGTSGGSPTTYLDIMIGARPYGRQTKTGFNPRFYFPAPSSGFAEGLFLNSWLDFGLASGWYSGVTQIARLPAAATTLTIDFNANLPRLRSAAVDIADPARPRYTWVADGPLTAAHGGFVSSYWMGATTFHRWSAVIGGSSEVRYPQMPDSLAAYRGSAATLPAVSYVQFLRSTALGSAAAFRAQYSKYFSTLYAFSAIAPTTPFVLVNTCLQVGTFSCQGN